MERARIEGAHEMVTQRVAVRVCEQVRKRAVEIHCSLQILKRAEARNANALSMSAVVAARAEPPSLSVICGHSMAGHRYFDVKTRAPHT